LWDVEVIEAGRGIIQQAATGFRTISMITVHDRLASLFSRLEGRLMSGIAE
jgi:hypothetical protein